MLILRIRQAEIALAAGRLDEAYDLAQSPDLRSHRRGQELIGQLVAAFVRRGQEHLSGQRWQQALADAQRAFKLGGNRPEVSQLQAAVAEVFTSRQESEHRKADAVAEARQHVRDGQLTMAEGLLGEAGFDGVPAAALRREAAARRAGVEPALGQAQAALERQDWDAAIRAVLDARQLHASNPKVTDLATKIGLAVLQEIRTAIDAGRMDRAEVLIGRLTPLAGRTIDLHELDRVVGQCRQAAQRIAQGRPQEAEQILRQLTAIVPKAGWLKEAIAVAQQAAEGLEQLRTGPLGLIMASESHSRERLQPLPEDHDLDDVTRKIPVPAPSEAVAGRGVPQRFLLHVDGVGSYLVVRKASVTFGPASTSNECDVSLMAEAGLSGVAIERVDEDYFLRARQAVIVNDRPVTQKLLVDGDRIALSLRCRVKFGLPNAASTSAVVQLSGTRLAGTDARRIILLDHEIVIGPGSASHIRADGLAEPVVLYVRGDQLCCRAKQPVLVNDAALDGSAGLPLGSSVRIGPMSMVVTEVLS